MLDTRAGLVAPPAPQAHDLISRTLVVHSGQELRFDRWTRIVFAPRSNGLMRRNERQEGESDRRIALVGRKLCRTEVVALSFNNVSDKEGDAVEQGKDS